MKFTTALCPFCGGPTHYEFVDLSKERENNFLKVWCGTEDGKSIGCGIYFEVLMGDEEELVKRFNTRGSNMQDGVCRLVESI